MPTPTKTYENCRLYKADLTGRPRDYEHPGIDWILSWITRNQLALLRADSRSPYFLVSVWPEHEKPSDPRYAQQFSGRVVSKEDLKNARSYAKECLRQGAVMTAISLWMFIPKEFDFKNVYGEDWEMK
jgi:hypothetical protein